MEPKLNKKRVAIFMVLVLIFGTTAGVGLYVLISM